MILRVSSAHPFKVLIGPTQSRELELLETGIPWSSQEFSPLCYGFPRKILRHTCR